MSLNADGRVNGASPWRRADNSIAQGWEILFGDLIQTDGVIGPASDRDENSFLDGLTRYQIYTNGVSLPLKGEKGRRLSKQTSKRWVMVIITRFY